jgi:type II secretion system protein G
MKGAMAIMLMLLIAGIVYYHYYTGQVEDEKGRQISIDISKDAIRRILAGLEKYNRDVGDYPSEDEGGLNALITWPTFDDETKKDKWAGPYLKRKNLGPDLWRSQYAYKLLEEEHGNTTRQVVHVWSYGPDGQDDSGEDDDIKSWE